MAWKLYDVSVSGYGSEVITAPSRGKALSAAFRSDAFNAWTFKEFLKEATAYLRVNAPPDDGYGYVRQRYDVDPKIGQRVTCAGCGASAGLSGTVLYPGRSTASVLVLFDGREDPSNVHPTDLEYVPSPTFFRSEGE